MKAISCTALGIILLAMGYDLGFSLVFILGLYLFLRGLYLFPAFLISAFRGGPPAR